jgi:hypothetical protein
MNCLESWLLRLRAVGFRAAGAQFLALEVSEV